MGKTEASIICSDCGSEDFEYPANPKPDDMVTCNGCGRQDTYGALEAQALAQFEDLIKKGLGDLFD